MVGTCASPYTFLPGMYDGLQGDFGEHKNTKGPFLEPLFDLSILGYSSNTWHFLKDEDMQRQHNHEYSTGHLDTFCLKQQISS